MDSDQEEETFGKKLSKDQRKKAKKLARKDKIISNYGAIGENARQRQLGEKMLSQKASASSKVISKGKNRKAVVLDEKQQKERLKKSRLVLPTRVLNSMGQGK